MKKKITAWAVVNLEGSLLPFRPLHAATGNLAVFESKASARLIVEYSAKLQSARKGHDYKYKILPVEITFTPKKK